MKNLILDCEIDELLYRIANKLIIHTSYFSNLGLYHGKMGIVLFFAHYARYTNCSIYDDFAGELIDDIFDDIDDELPINFESGLCGIGWGIEYLLKNGFLEDCSSEILSEIDKKIMEKDLTRISDISVKTGLKGISYYVYKRINSLDRSLNIVSFDEKYLKVLNELTETMTIPSDKDILLEIVETTPIRSLEEWKIGINNGCAGYGLNYLLK
ncbi:hypothetical protein SDC9_53116 [bioreactor metagenome]|uniref:Lanthionine synthetase C-like protein n=1 Tax=bioreactor metagenome TaxID=1076179 RepID=A0A644WXN9_9ZZZZ